jgi:hypothetical protein
VVTALDSFIEYLAAELSGIVPIHWVRHWPEDESAGVFQRNALNVMLLGAQQNGSMEELMVSLDLVGSDARTTHAWADSIRDLLIERQFCPERNYSPNPASPVPLNKMVSWEGNDVAFNLVSARPWRKQEATGTEGSDVHLNCTIQICHSRM